MSNRLLFLHRHLYDDSALLCLVDALAPAHGRATEMPWKGFPLPYAKWVSERERKFCK
jgi:hypothetical protein